MSTQRWPSSLSVITRLTSTIGTSRCALPSALTKKLRGRSAETPAAALSAAVGAAGAALSWAEDRADLLICPGEVMRQENARRANHRGVAPTVANSSAALYQWLP